VACATTTGPAPSPLEQALVTLRHRPAWLFEPDRCPADVMPATEQGTKMLEDLCVNDLPACLDRCQARDPSGCYSAALRVQQLRSDVAASEALFLRACRLGSMSGCTNRAAGMTKNGDEGEAAVRCAVRTFQRTCQANDPWGCTMLGWHLIEGQGIERDLDRARRALNQACVPFGDEDPACVRAKELLEQVDGAEKGKGVWKTGVNRRGSCRSALTGHSRRL